jgi:hypothetical protein
MITAKEKAANTIHPNIHLNKFFFEVTKNEVKTSERYIKTAADTRITIMSNILTAIGEALELIRNNLMVLKKYKK